MKDKSDNSRGRENELTQAYKSYANYVFPNDENHHPVCKNASDSVLCTPTNDECQFTNWKCVLQNCSAFTYIDLPGVERYSTNQIPMIMFNTFMTEFNCSHHGILIHKKITTCLDAKETYKKTCDLCEQLIPN